MSEGNISQMSDTNALIVPIKNSNGQSAFGNFHSEASTSDRSECLNSTRFIVAAENLLLFGRRKPPTKAFDLTSNLNNIRGQMEHLQNVDPLCSHNAAWGGHIELRCDRWIPPEQSEEQNSSEIVCVMFSLSSLQRLLHSTEIKIPLLEISILLLRLLGISHISHWTSESISKIVSFSWLFCTSHLRTCRLCG